MTSLAPMANDKKELIINGYTEKLFCSKPSNFKDLLKLKRLLVLTALAYLTSILRYSDLFDL